MNAEIEWIQFHVFIEFNFSHDVYVIFKQTTFLSLVHKQKHSIAIPPPWEPKRNQDNFSYQFEIKSLLFYFLHPFLLHRYCIGRPPFFKDIIQKSQYKKDDWDVERISLPSSHASHSLDRNSGLFYILYCQLLKAYHKILFSCSLIKRKGEIWAECCAYRQQHEQQRCCRFSAAGRRRLFRRPFSLSRWKKNKTHTQEL